MHRLTSALRSLRWLVVFSCVACGAATLRTAPGEPIVLTMRPVGVGAEVPQLAQLSDGSVMVLWRGRDGSILSQRIDPRTGELLGPTGSTGLTDDSEFQRAGIPIAIALPSSDLAVLTVDRRGSVLLARGSFEPARRLAARELVVGGGLVAAADHDEIVLLGFGVHRAYGAEFSEPIRVPGGELELHWFGPNGRPTREPLRWHTHLDVKEARLAACGGKYYVAYSDHYALTTTVVGPKLERESERVVRLPDTRQSYRLGPIVCDAEQAWLFARLGSFEGRSTSQLYVVPLSPGAGELTGRLITLPGEPAPRYGEDLPVYSTGEGQVSLIVGQSDGFRVIRVDLTGKRQPVHGGPAMQTDECLPLRGGAGAICGYVTGETTRHMELLLYGESGEPSSELSVSDGYWSHEASDQPTWQRAPLGESD